MLEAKRWGKQLWSYTIYYNMYHIEFTTYRLVTAIPEANTFKDKDVQGTLYYTLMTYSGP